MFNSVSHMELERLLVEVNNQVFPYIENSKSVKAIDIILEFTNSLFDAVKHMQCYKTAVCRKEGYGYYLDLRYYPYGVRRKWYLAYYLFI